MDYQFQKMTKHFSIDAQKKGDVTEITRDLGRNTSGE